MAKKPNKQQEKNNNKPNNITVIEKTTEKVICSKRKLSLDMKYFIEKKYFIKNLVLVLGADGR